MRRAMDEAEAVLEAYKAAKETGKVFVVCRREEVAGEVEWGMTDYAGWSRISRKFGWEGMVKVGPATPQRMAKPSTT